MVPKSNPVLRMAVMMTLLIVAIVTALVIINAQAQKETDVALERQPPIEGQPVLGNSDAPVTVVEFGDYKCPACKAWGEQFFPYLLEGYVAKGLVKFSYINVLFHGEESELGSAAAEAVYKQDPDSYWEFHKKLFSQQPSATHHVTKWLTMETIEAVAADIPEIDLNKLREDMQSQEIAQELKKDSDLAEEFNVQLTPTIMVNGTELKDPFDYELILSLIDSELEDSRE